MPLSLSARDVSRAVAESMRPVLKELDEIRNEQRDVRRRLRVAVTHNADPLRRGDPAGAATRRLNAATHERAAALERFAERDEKKGLGLNAAACLRVFALAQKQGYGPDRAVDVARELKYGDELIGKIDSHVKALGSGVLADGGFLIPPEYAAEIIELLNAAAVVRKAGARAIPMPRGTMSFRKKTAASTAYWVGESSTITASQPTGGIVIMSGKKLAALIPTSNDLLRNASPEADALIRDELVIRHALGEDSAYLRGVGTDFTPKGIRYWANASNVTAATQAGASATLYEVINDLEMKLIYKLTGGNVPVTKDSGAFFMHPRSAAYLRTLVDGTGKYFFREEMRDGRLSGYQYHESTQIPINLGSGTNESEVLFAHMADCIIGDELALIVEFLANASYHDGSAVVSGASDDESVFRAIGKHDFLVQRDLAAAVLSTVKWGA